VVVALLGVLGAANLIAEWTMARAQKAEKAERAGGAADVAGAGSVTAEVSRQGAVDSAAPGS
jgi:hypothetical protein